MDKEVWKDVKHYEGLYKISSQGRVWSVTKQDYKIPHVKENGYWSVQLYKNRKMKNEYIHRLVALTFIPNPEHLPQINHKDENKSNNAVSNLEWCDQSYNMNYGTVKYRLSNTHRKLGTYENARQKWRENNPSKTNPKTHGNNSYAKKISCDGVVFECIKDCANYYGVNYGTMRYWLCGDGNIPKYFREHNLHYITE